MKKREFLSAAASLAALTPIGTLAVETRRFGIPASVTAIAPEVSDKLRLSLARASIPSGAWAQTVAFVNGLNALADSAAARTEFSASPRAYFDSYGVSTTTNFEQSRDVALARLMMDTAAMSAADAGDYGTFLQRLRDFNLPTAPDYKGLSAKIADLIRNDIDLYNRVKAALEAPGATADTVGHALVAVTSVDSTAIGSGSDADVVVFIEAVTETVVLVETVALAVVVVISALVVTIIAIVVGQGVAAGEKGVANLLQGRLSAIDKDIVEGAATTVAAARLLGNTSFEIRVATDLVKNETEAIFAALEQVGLVKIDAAQRTTILQKCQAAGLRSLGLVA